MQNNSPSMLRVIVRQILFSLREGPRSLKYWLNHGMFWVDLGFWCLYVLRSPYRISRRFIRSNGGSLNFTFGDTPLSTLERICCQAGIPEGMVIFDVGCGWGRSTYFLHAYCKAYRSIGIDIIPTYIKKAEKIREWLGLNYMVFLKADIRKVDYSDADVIYMYGTCFEKELVREMVAVWEDSLADGTMLISASQSLCPYSTLNRIQLKECVWIEYSWGDCPVFFHIVATPS